MYIITVQNPKFDHGACNFPLIFFLRFLSYFPCLNPIFLHLAVIQRTLLYEKYTVQTECCFSYFIRKMCYFFVKIFDFLFFHFTQYR
jgi:hypothetical protein